jgi:hypothetical protein
VAASHARSASRWAASRLPNRRPAGSTPAVTASRGGSTACRRTPFR